MRFGKCKNKVYGQGMILVLPFIDEATIVDLRFLVFIIVQNFYRVTTIELPTIYLFTSDRGIIELFSVVLIRVLDPLIACCTVQNFKQVFF
jgi:regulator of protease activity HflC (stomatin/prohibitin superfamily)